MSHSSLYSSLCVEQGASFALLKWSSRYVLADACWMAILVRLMLERHYYSEAKTVVTAV